MDGEITWGGKDEEIGELYDMKVIREIILQTESKIDKLLHELGSLTKEERFMINIPQVY